MSIYSKKIDEIKKDPHQYAAYTAKNSSVVIAGPGSGKTTVLTLKIMSLLQNDIVSPRGLACITYSRAAAKEFSERLYSYGYIKRENVFLGTVHSFCISEIIRPFAHLFNYGIPLPLKIISEQEKELEFRKTLISLNISPTDLSIEEMDKERTSNIVGISKIDIPSYDMARSVAKKFESRLQTSGKIDYVSIVNYAALLIQNEKYVRDCLEAKFPWLLVDEYQDLGKPLHEMVLSILNLTKIKIFAIGDPNQSIYGFNGATPFYLLELFNNSVLTPIRLLTNFRSNQDIIDASQLALPRTSIQNYKAGNRINEQADFKFIVCNEGIEDQLQKVAQIVLPECINTGTKLDDIGILVPSNPVAKRLSEIFQENNIPHYMNKRKDFEFTEVLRWLVQCGLWLNETNSTSFSELFDFWASLFKQHKGYSISDNLFERKKFYNILCDSKLYSQSLNDWIHYVLKNLKLLELLTDSNFYADEIGNFDKLIQLTSHGEFKTFTLDQFVQLLMPKNQVTITTRHSSKGLEFEIIILLGLEENNFPSYKSIQRYLAEPQLLEEQYRLFFVCISRAKKGCYLLRSLTEKNRYGTLFSKEPSRFWTMLHDVYGE